MKKLYVVLAIILIGGAGFFMWWQLNKAPVNILDKTQKIFVVSNNENVRDIASSLKQQGLIRSPIVFFLTIKQLSLDQKIQAGDFSLSPSMSTSQIIQNLTHGTLDVRVTIPEGKRATEIAEILSKKISSYDSSFATALATQEGYLFPDTYLFPRNITISQIMAIMEGNFNKKYEEAQALKSVKLSQQQTVILASIVEREAVSVEDKKLAASVLENRLAAGMALGSDVTLEYALGYQPYEHTWWKKDLTADDLNLNSLYNTRLNAGLPPTPISNPGLVSLEAVLNPPQTDYLYYVSDSNGVLHFAKTLEGHNANIKKYMQ